MLIRRVADCSQAVIGAPPNARAGCLCRYCKGLFTCNWSPAPVSFCPTFAWPEEAK